MVVLCAVGHDGAVGFNAVLLIIIGLVSYPVAWWRDGCPGAVRGHIRARGWGLLLPPLALMYAGVSTPHHWLVIAEVLAGCLIMIFAPRAARKIVPFALLGLAFVGVVLARRLQEGYFEQYMYGLVLAGAGSSRKFLVLPESGLFLVAGLWVLTRVRAPGSEWVTAAVRRWWRGRGGGILPGQELLLLLVMMMAILLTHNWLGGYGLTPVESVVLNVAASVGAMTLVFRSRLWAATVAAAGLLVLGAYGILVAMYWPDVPGRWYGLVALDTYGHAFFGGIIEGTVLFTLGVWLAPRVMGQHLGLREAELAAKAQRLTERVQTLTQTRSDAVDTAAAELRRIERDLHDGAQARLVALGMSLQAAERLFMSSPEAALALVSEAKEASSRALTELRGLVRGIYPPVLADRGLADAVKALAMDTPLHTVVDIDLPGEVEMPVGSAVYFAVAEALTNAAKHSGARTIHIQLHYEHETLRAEVTDDGAGGADPEQGTGLKGVERRLATFDGILAVSSPPGGPTIVVIEVPCALSSPKTSSC